MNDEYKKRLTFEVSKEQHKKIRQLAMDNDVTVSEVIRCFIDSIDENKESIEEMLWQQNKKRQSKKKREKSEKSDSIFIPI